MDNIKELMKKVKVPESIHIAPRSASEKGVNLKALKKGLEDKRNEKLKVYGFIGMEVYDLAKEEKIDFPQIKNYIEKMDEINQSIETLEKQIKEQEAENVGKNVCACGFKLKPQDRFCPNCGEVVQRDTILCTCGAELKKDIKFCSSCGKSLEEILKIQEENKRPPMKECICGNMVPDGQFMCLECGRKIE